MEFAPDLLSALRSRVLAPADPGLAEHCDWPGLHARMCAAHAARREIGRADTRFPVRDGGFGDWPLTTHRAAQAPPNTTHAVNLTDSTDSKQLQGMNANIAVLSNRGDRGQQ